MADGMGWREGYDGRYKLGSLQEIESSSDGSRHYDEGTTYEGVDRDK